MPQAVRRAGDRPGRPRFFPPGWRSTQTKSAVAERGRGTLGLEPGEDREFTVLTALVVAGTAVVILLSAGQNGLFLSVHPDRLIPHAVIAAAFPSALLSAALSGVMPRLPRRLGADGLDLFLALYLVAGRIAFAVDPSNAFVLYVWLSEVQVLMVTHAWDFVSSFFTGREAKRLMPPVGTGASVGVLIPGIALVPAADVTGTANLLPVALILLLATMALRRPVPAPNGNRWRTRTAERSGRSWASPAGVSAACPPDPSCGCWRWPPCSWCWRAPWWISSSSSKSCSASPGIRSPPSMGSSTGPWAPGPSPCSSSPGSSSSASTPAPRRWATPAP